MIAETVPKFGSLLDVVGGSTVTMLTFVCPPYFYMKLCDQSKDNKDWIQRYYIFRKKSAKLQFWFFFFFFFHIGKFQHGNVHIAGFWCSLDYWGALPLRMLLVKISLAVPQYHLVGGLEPEILHIPVADLMDKKNAMYFYYLHKSSQQRINSRETLFFFSSKWKWWHLLYGSDSLFITRSWKIRTICNCCEICFWRNNICVRTNSLCPIHTGKTTANTNRKWSSVENWGLGRLGIDKWTHEKKLHLLTSGTSWRPLFPVSESHKNKSLSIPFPHY